MNEHLQYVLLIVGFSLFIYSLCELEDWLGALYFYLLARGLEKLGRMKGN